MGFLGSAQFPTTSSRPRKRRRRSSESSFGRVPRKVCRCSSQKLRARIDAGKCAEMIGKSPLQTKTSARG